MITVHMIGNAHLDPVWFWRWPVGVTEAISTCRTAADLLEEYDEFIFTRSDVWVYEQIEMLDPRLFERIRALVEQGRWRIVGGWYIQPDCNLPLGESFQKHHEIGKEYFRDRFGVDVTVGYNVDSFGHAGSLPQILSENGFDSYVMMRPGPHEKELPSSLFRWRSHTGGEVVTWRIHKRYNCKSPKDIEDNLTSLLETAVPDGIDHVMCFYGVGDHGGGPTREQIEWISENRHSFPNAVLRFSDPVQFFEAVKPYYDRMPVVEDELQYHAVGCYSVLRDLKTSMRRAENSALAAENALHSFGNGGSARHWNKLDDAWRKILFNQFHDILAGTSVPRACVDARDQLGRAADQANEVIYWTLFNSLQEMRDDELQRIVLFNLSGEPYSGYVEHEPWQDSSPFEGRIYDESGTAVPYQLVQQPALSGARKMALFHAHVPARGIATYRLDPESAPPAVDSPFRSTNDSIENAQVRVHAQVGSSEVHIHEQGTSALGRIRIKLAVYEDLSDTWSHWVEGYRNEPPTGHFSIVGTELEEDGPLRTKLRVDGKFGNSRSSLRFLLYRDSAEVEIRAHLDWAERLRIAKLEFDFPAAITSRTDGIPGGHLRREQDGQEYPITNWSSLHTDAGSRTFLLPDVFALDGYGNSIGLSLCRAPAYAWQGKKLTLTRDDVEHWTDQGSHDFSITLNGLSDLDKIGRRSRQLTQRPIALDWTRGMPGLPGRGKGEVRE